MASFVLNKKEIIENNYFRRVLFTGKNVQHVAMALRPSENIGTEIHKRNTQIVEVIDGKGLAIINGEKIYLSNGKIIDIEPGDEHDIIASDHSWLRILTIYSPPLHPEGEINKTKPLHEEGE